jgi:DNA-damage-inducible protein J
MATKSSIQVRLDETLKKDAEAVFDNLGVDVPTAIRIFFKKVVATRSIPFSLEESPYSFTKEEEAKILKAAEESLDPASTVAVTKTPQETQQFLDSLKR